jgi:hypothetical protein
MEAIADGIWRWTARHPEWHPRTTFGSEVASYVLRDGGDTLVVDPIAPGGDVTALLDQLDGIVTGRVRILLTIPYHVRDAEPVWRHYRDRPATIFGHPAVAKRLTDHHGFRALSAGVAIDSGILPVPIGNPRRYEMPLFVPEHRALVFGDAIVAADGAVRVWIQLPVTPKRLDWYQRRLRPSFEPLLDVDCDRLLVTHGQPVLTGGRRALREALDEGPWYHRPN